MNTKVRFIYLSHPICKVGLMGLAQKLAAIKRFQDPTQRKRLYEWGERGREKRRVRVNLEPSEYLFYVVGALKGDGTICMEVGGKSRYQVTLDAGPNQRFADAFKQATLHLGARPYTWFDRKRNMWRTVFHGQDFCEWYNGLEMEWIKRMGIDNRKLGIAFIRGVYEAEGSLTSNNYGKSDRIEIGMLNKQVINVVRELLQAYNYHIRYYVDRNRLNKKERFRVVIFDRNDIRRFLNEISPCIKSSRSPRRSES